MDKRIIVLGGGTIEPIKNHFSVCAPAFGTTAKQIHKLIPDSKLVLTKMCSLESKIISNSDLELYINNLLEDKSVGTIIMNCAVCDFKHKGGDFHGDRLKTSEGNINIELEPTEKIISKIRIRRPDIFLVGFKTTTNLDSENQFLTGLKMMKSSKCNLVLANDTVTRNNMIITPEETFYCETTNRDKVLKELCDMILLRNNLTYDKNIFIKTEDNFGLDFLPSNFKNVLKYLIDNGGYIENNGNGFTPGHFCYKNSEEGFFSSQRKVNHNKVLSVGLSLITVKNDKFTICGKTKASIGARSQWLILKDNPDYDCIIHTHNPIKENSKLPIVEQRPYQCGSIECGLNTVNNLESFLDGEVKAVFLEKHGINLLFKSSTNHKIIENFINNNIKLGEKIK